jgi:hypothetical protein
MKSRSLNLNEGDPVSCCRFFRFEEWHDDCPLNYNESTMKVNHELSEKLRGKRFLRPDRKVMTVSHVNQLDGPGGPYFSVFYNVDKPEIGDTGAGSCWLDTLESLVEVQGDSYARRG